jgi:hypothetical protein
MSILKYLLFFFIAVSCAPKKNVSTTNTFSNNGIENSFVCPNNGECNLEIIKNKSLTIKIINENLTSYDIVDDSSKIIVKYKYTVNQDQTIYDGGYAEEIVFEINATDYHETLSDNDLIKAKIFYRRFCACRGKTGLIQIKKGKLEINNSGHIINLNLQFDCGSIPQVIKNIKVIDGKL